MVATRDCIFCKIINKQIPAKIIFENDTVLAFPDINPKANTHILIVPKEHREGLSALKQGDVELSGRLILAVSDLAKQLGMNSYRAIINCGPDAGQTVFHLHVHLLSPEGIKF